MKCFKRFHDLEEHLQRQLAMAQHGVVLDTLMSSLAPVKLMQLLVICSCSFLKINTEGKKNVVVCTGDWS